jgi:DNA-binding XRE family transcriptional regulator
MVTQVAQTKKVITPRGSVVKTAKPRARRAEAVSPIGSTAEIASARRASRSPEYRAQQEELRSIREISWLLIKYRMEMGITQERLAELVGTSNTQISRIESGRHRTNLSTLKRIAEALDVTLVVGFESRTRGGKAKRDLVSL